MYPKNIWERKYLDEWSSKTKRRSQKQRGTMSSGQNVGSENMLFIA